MTVSLIDGQRSWSMARDAEGYRTYTISHKVRCAPEDGPGNALRTPGLPLPGAAWIVDDDVDLWVWCRPDARVTPSVEDAPNKQFIVEQIFSNKPQEGTKQQRCHDAEVENPLLEPQKVSGGSIKYTEEATRDRFGRALATSSHEMIRGPQVEFDRNRPSVHIEQNVAVLGLETVEPLQDTVNDAPLWGFPRRCIKLSNFTWEKKYYGQCFIYYTRVFDFDVNVKVDPGTGVISSGFDRDILDEGTKVLKGHWSESTGEWVLDNIDGVAPDPYNPAHFIRAKGADGENIRIVLNGLGQPAGALTALKNKFISIAEPNLGQALKNRTWWIPLSSTVPTFWDFETDESPQRVAVSVKEYLAGTLVEFGPTGSTSLYVATTNIKRGTRAPGIETAWLQIQILTDEGTYSAAATYEIGDVVRDVATTVPGNRHVEKYDEGNFLLLGIPTVL